MKEVKLSLFFAFCSIMMQAQVFKAAKPTLNKTRANYAVIYPTDLKICGSGSDCLLHGLPFTSGPLHLAASKQQASFQFLWSTQAPEIDGIRWQVSTHLFDNNSTDNPFGLVRTGISNSKKKEQNLWKGNFTINFSDFAKPNLLRKSIKTIKPRSARPGAKFSTKNKLTRITPKVNFSAPSAYYFIRIIPYKNGSAYYNASNVIVLRFDDLPKDGNFTYVEPVKRKFENLYSISINNFTPIQPPTKDWGTSKIIGFDEAKYNQVKNLPGMKELRKNYQNKMNANQLLYCKSYKGVGSEGWLESLWNATSSAADWVSNAYEWPKQQLVNGAAGMIDQIPGVNCETKCKELLKGGLEAGLVAVGVPPSLPNADELLDGGVEYLASEAASQIGCGDACTGPIKSQIENLGNQLTSHHRSVVNNSDEAHRFGKEPLNVPNWVNVKIVKETAIQPAQLSLRIYRNNSSISDSSLLKHLYIQVNFTCTNSHYKKGSKVSVPVNTDYKDGYSVNYQHESLTLPATPVMDLFQSKLIPVPILEKGQTLDFTIYPQALFGYLFPGHYEKICQAGGHIFHDDWMKMYMAGTAKITVRLVGDQEINFNDPYANTERYTILQTKTMTYQLPNEFPGELRPRHAISCFH